MPPAILDAALILGGAQTSKYGDFIDYLPLLIFFFYYSEFCLIFFFFPAMTPRTFVVIRCYSLEFFDAVTFWVLG